MDRYGPHARTNRRRAESTEVHDNGGLVTEGSGSGGGTSNYSGGLD
ncbi:hypothetical protein GCM10009765_19680 [Fodinicola feengrottensis]|uniref:Uncharacterized protein n=1 Tax=Fodinicola feengrottensis TaxID=435914 RepID=A0ABN2GG53_9ACTN